MNGCIIQARTGSSRLPGKVMMKIKDDNPMLYYVIQQTKQSKLIDSLIVATTQLEEDDIIFDYVNSLGVKCFRGSSNDVLDRFYQCTKKFSFSTITRITADCPLIDPKIIDTVILAFNSNNFDYVTNTQPRTFPYGTEVEVYSSSAIEKAYRIAKKPSEREHISPFFWNNENFSIYNVENNRDLSNLRWTVDRIEDFILVQEILKRINKFPIFLSDILEIYEKDPELFKINQHISHNEGLLKSFKEDEEFLRNN